MVSTAELRVERQNPGVRRAKPPCAFEHPLDPLVILLVLVS